MGPPQSQEDRPWSPRSSAQVAAGVEVHVWLLLFSQGNKREGGQSTVRSREEGLEVIPPHGYLSPAPTDRPSLHRS